MKVYKLISSETEYFCGKTLIHALKVYLEDSNLMLNYDLSDDDDIQEVPKDEWHEIKFKDEESGKTRTIAEHMKNANSAGVICSTAY